MFAISGEKLNFTLKNGVYIAYFADLANFSGDFCVSLHQNLYNMDKELINRIKVVLAEKNLTNKWLAEQLDKDQGTVSKWVTNTSQPDLKTLIQIAQCLNVGIQDLLRNSNP